jgi:membrane fusion protein
MSPPDEVQQAELRLFRAEAYAAQLERVHGTILLVRPPGFWAYVTVSVFAAVTLVLFVVLASYTRRESVHGVVAADQAIARVYSPVEGTVLKRLITEGQQVSKGQTLFVLSTETHRPSKGSAESAIAQQLALRLQELQGERARRENMYAESYRALRDKVRTLGESIEQARSQQQLQSLKVKVAKRNVQRLRELAGEGFAPQSQLDDREADLLNEKAKLAAASRSVVDATTELEATRSQLENAPLEQKNVLSQLDRQTSELREQDISNDAHREVAITSQIEGLATAPLTDAGDVVSPATLLTSVEPSGARPDAYLYVPSRAIGFVKLGTPVNVRYDAFPYQKFGQYAGRVSEISRTALAPSELREVGEEKEALYRVTVVLDVQEIVANGEKIPLQNGMKLDADLMLETRKIYEWMLQPLYSLTGRFAEGVSR